MFKEATKLDTWIDEIDSFIELEDGCCVASNVIDDTKIFVKEIYGVDSDNPWHRRCGVEITPTETGSILFSIQAVDGTFLDIEFLSSGIISLYHYTKVYDEGTVIDLLYKDVVSVEDAVKEFKDLIEHSAI